MKKRSSVKVIFAMMLMTISILAVCSSAMAGQKIRLNKKNVKITAGQKTKLVLKGAKKARWSSSDRKVASVNGKGVVTARKAGTAVITAKYNGKNYKAKVTVSPLPETEDIINEYLNPNDYLMLDNAVSITPYHVYYKDGNMYADCYVINGFSHKVYNTNVKRLTLSNESGIIAEAAFGVIAGGKKISGRKYYTHTFIFTSSHYMQNARLTGTVSADWDITYE